MSKINWSEEVLNEMLSTPSQALIEDIAKIISRTTSAVKMRLQKGRKLLEEIYRKEYL